jgi:hypothetical protein
MCEEKVIGYRNMSVSNWPSVLKPTYSCTLPFTHNLKIDKALVARKVMRG